MIIAFNRLRAAEYISNKSNGSYLESYLADYINFDFRCLLAAEFISNGSYIVDYMYKKRI